MGLNAFRLVLAGVVAGAVLAPGAARAGFQQNSPRYDPVAARWERRCGGVDQTLAAAYSAALSHVRARRLDEAKFEKGITHDCPCRDLIYFGRIFRR